MNRQLFLPWIIDVILISLLLVGCGIPLSTFVPTNVHETPVPVPSAKLTQTPRSTETQTPIGNPKPKLSSLALTYADIDLMLPGYYSPPTDITNQFPTNVGNVLEKYAYGFSSEKGAATIAVILTRYKYSTESSNFVKLLHEVVQENVVAEIALPPNWLNEQAWMVELEKQVELAFNQGEVMVVIILFPSPDLKTTAIEMTILIGQLQQSRLEEGGYK